MSIFLGLVWELHLLLLLLSDSRFWNGPGPYMKLTQRLPYTPKLISHHYYNSYFKCFPTILWHITHWRSRNEHKWLHKITMNFFINIKYPTIPILHKNSLSLLIYQGRIKGQKFNLLAFQNPKKLKSFSPLLELFILVSLSPSGRFPNSWWSWRSWTAAALAFFYVKRCGM